MSNISWWDEDKFGKNLEEVKIHIALSIKPYDEN